MFSHIFRQYDIRGIVGKDLDTDVAESVGRAFGSHVRSETGLDKPSVAVGYDNRDSSPDLTAALVRGLRAAGSNVTDLGTAPTPLVYWAEKMLGTDASVVITGSHNPPEWNGIKMTVRGASLYGDAITGLRDRIEENDLASGAGEYERVDVLERYIEDIIGRFDLARPVRVAVDCGNGTGSLVAERLLTALGAEVTPLFCDSDPTFPNHHPDPTVDENLEELIRVVREQKLELGVAFDGDADRIGVVDGDGNIVRGDILLLIYGLDILKRRGPGEKLVFDVKCSQALPEVYAAAGGEPIMWQTGHSLIKRKMKETGARIAGELSGHIMIADDYLGFDDALYDACRLVDLVARSDRTIAEQVAAFPQYVSTPEIRIEVTEEDKWRIVEEAVAHFKTSHDVIDVDGARVLFGDGWALLRTSNTQPVIVARFEARSQERLDEIRAEVGGWLETRGVSLP
ncbi:MAG: phosphomannomutase/phosphoglucomutase [Gemmatimonadota bacterium]